MAKITTIIVCAALGLAASACTNERVEHIGAGGGATAGLQVGLSTPDEPIVIPGQAITVTLGIKGNATIEDAQILRRGRSNETTLITPGSLPFTHDFATTVPADARDGDVIEYTASVLTNEKKYFTGGPLVFTVMDLIRPADVTLVLSNPSDPAGYAPGETIHMTVSASDPNSGVGAVDIALSGPASPKTISDTVAPPEMSFNKVYEATVDANARCGTVLVVATVTDASAAKNGKTVGAVGTLAGGASHKAAPVVVFDAPAENAAVKPGDTVAVSVTATDDCGLVTSIGYEVTGAATASGTVTVPGGGENPTTQQFAFEVPTAAVDGAPIDVAVWGVDYDGLSGETTPVHRALTVTAKSAPTAAIDAPAGGSTVAPGDTVTVSVSAQSAGGAITKLALAVNGAVTSNDEFAVSPAAPTAAHDFSVPVPAGASDGAAITFTATAFDDSTPALAGTSAPVTVTVLSAAPTVQILFPQSGQTFYPGNSVRVSIKGTQKSSPVSTVGYSATGAVTGTDQYQGTAGQTLQHDFFLAVPASAGEGDVQITGSAVDTGSHTGASAPVTVKVKDKTAPAVTITAPAEAQTFAKGATMTVTVHAVDDSSNVASVSIAVSGAFTDSKTLVPATTTKDYTDSWDFAVPAGASTGDAYIDVRATDAATTPNTSSVVRRKVKVQ